MNTRLMTIIVLVLIGGATLAGTLLWNQLPDPMASHWNTNDQADGYMSKFWGVFLIPSIALGMFTLLIVAPKLDPLGANVTQFLDTYNLFITFFIVYMIYVYALTLLWNLGYTNLGVGKAILPAIGLLFVAIGSLLRKAKRNWFIGIRTPWTLSSDVVWEKTHQLGAVLFMISGGSAVIGGLIGGNIAFWMLFAPLIGSTIFLLVYSYVLYQRETKA